MLILMMFSLLAFSNLADLGMDVQKFLSSLFYSTGATLLVHYSEAFGGLWGLWMPKGQKQPRIYLLSVFDVVLTFRFWVFILTK